MASGSGSLRDGFSSRVIDFAGCATAQIRLRLVVNVVIVLSILLRRKRCEKHACNRCGP